MQPASRVALNTGFLYARMAITIIISLYSTRLILETLGSVDFGIFNVVGGVILMLGFLNASMTEATQRFIAIAIGKGDNKKANRIFNISFLLHLIVAALLFILLEVAGYFLLENFLNIPKERIEAAKLIYHFMVISTFVAVIAVPYDALLSAHENMLIYSIIGIIEAILKLIIAVYIVDAKSDRLVNYGMFMALLTILLLVLRVIYCRKVYKEAKLDLFKKYNKSDINEMVTFAGWTFLGSSTSMVSHYGQIIVINVFFGTLVNAAQAITNQISGQLGAFAHVIMKAVGPIIAKSEGSGNRFLMIKIAFLGSKVSFFLLTFLYIPILIELPFILKLWLKEVPPFTVIFCQLLLARNLIEQLFLNLITSINAVGKVKKYQICSSILWCLPIVVSYILFKYGFPPKTMYVVYICYSIISSINILYFSRKHFQLPVLLFCKNVIVRCVMTYMLIFFFSLLPTLIFEQSLVRLFYVLLVNSFSFLLLVWFLGFLKGERKVIKGVIISFVSKFVPGRTLPLAIKVNN